MRNTRLPLLTLCLLALLSRTATTRAADPKPAASQPAKAFELLNGDRVAFVGGSFFEREGQLGYIETALTTRFPDRNVTFRNLGYAGDTVRCESRTVCEGWANFGPPEEGFTRLKKLVTEIKPTVVFVAYGMGESFEGERRLPKFVEDYNKLLDMLTEAAGGKPRFVLIGPNSHEDMGRPLPEPAQHNKELKAYSAAIEQIAVKRGGRFVDLFAELPPLAKDQLGAELHWTEDGIHPDPQGFVVAAEVIEASLCGAREYRVDTDATGKVQKAKGLTAEAKPRDRGFDLTVHPTWLPLPAVEWPPGTTLQPYPITVAVHGLAPGRYSHTISRPDQVSGGGTTLDEKALDAGHAFFAAGALDVSSGERPEELRKLIVAKNADYFNYWRPENDTYILGYRKHEQGRNAVELPEFKPLVESKEKEIGTLRGPRPVEYSVRRIDDAAK